MKVLNNKEKLEKFQRRQLSIEKLLKLFSETEYDSLARTLSVLLYTPKGEPQPFNWDDNYLYGKIEEMLEELNTPEDDE